MFKNAIQYVKRNTAKIATGAAMAGAALVTTALPASAAAVLDFTAVGTAVTAELTPAIAAAMPIAGVILAAGIGWKLYKRFTK